MRLSLTLGACLKGRFPSCTPSDSDSVALGWGPGYSDTGGLDFPLERNAVKY